MNQPETSNDELARMINAGFQSVTDTMNRRLDRLEADNAEMKVAVVQLKEESAETKAVVVQMSERLDTLEEKVDILDGKVNVLDAKVTRIDRRTENQADSLYEDMHELKDRVVAVEKKVGIVPPKPKLAVA